MQPLSDGVYDAFIVDVASDEENFSIAHIELTITSGEHKGEVVRVRATKLQRDPIELIGLPVTLTVSGGQPRVQFDA
jgi:hypothetical protein